MTRLLTCGYETGDVNEVGTSTAGGGSTISVVNSTPTPRAGGAYCLKIATSTTTFTLATKAFSLPASKTDVWVRCAVYFHPLSTSNELVVLGWQDSAANAQACITWDPATGLLRARQGTSGAGTVLGTSSSAMPADQWHVVEWRHQMTSATVGVTELWLDGTRVINFSGDNTSSATVNVQTLLIGMVTTTTVVSGTYLAFDDLAINDTAGTVNNGRPGDGRVVLLTPTGAGSNTTLSRGGTDSGANWNQVDELPPSMTDYVFSATAATRDTYALSDLPAGVTSVNVAEVLVLAQNSDVGAGSLGLTIKSGATTNEGTAQTLGTSAVYIRQQYETDPNTSAAWTVAAVNALEAGVTVR